MKISVLQENLNKALLVVSRIVSQRASLPILNNVLINVDKSQLKVSATNLEIGIIYSIGAKIEQSGSVSVPAKLFSELISSLPQDKIQLSEANSNLKIKTIDFESNLNGIDVEEFPVIPEISDSPVFTMDSSPLVNLLSEVVFCASIDESRPVLAGVLFEINKNILKLAATDSYRLSQKITSIKSEKNLKVILPIRASQEIIRILSSDDDGKEVKVYLNENEAMFEFGKIKLVSRLIEGNFPSYEQIIPQKTDLKVIIDRDQLLGSVKVANLFARESSNAIKMKINEKDLIEISASAAQVGENNSALKAKVTGEAMDININGKYLLDVLNVIKTEKVSLELSGKLNPCMIRPHDPKKDQKDTTYIIMPLRS